MASAKEIKNHIGSVKSTQKVTNAMYLISSTKMRRAREELAQTQPYFDALRTEICRAFQHSDSRKSHYVAGHREEKPGDAYGYLVLTADRGLAGAYNQNVIQKALHLMEQHQNNRLFVIGDYGRQYFRSHRIPVEKSFLYAAQSPSVPRAREMGALLLDLYDRGEIQRLYVVYTEMGDGMDLIVHVDCLLPIYPETFAQDGQEENELRFEPSADAVLARAIPSYVTGYLYSAVVESFCAEQSARTSAMDLANQNAQELLEELTAEYNHERQSAITQEITEISAGERAEKQHAKERRSHE